MNFLLITYGSGVRFPGVLQEPFAGLTVVLDNVLPFPLLINNHVAHWGWSSETKIPLFMDFARHLLVPLLLILRPQRAERQNKLLVDLLTLPSLRPVVVWLGD